MTEEFQKFKLKTVKGLSMSKAKKYINKYFIPLTDGRHAMLIANVTYTYYEEDKLKKTYFKRMNKELSDYYFKENDNLREVVFKLNYPVLFDDYINMCPSFLHTVKPYDSYDKKMKKRVNVMLSYVKEVLADNNEEVYDYLLKWTANMAKGKRNDSALYLKGIEGLGKSTFFEFLRTYVFGEDLCYQGGSRPLTSKFNGELSGKMLVVFEELESVSAGEWMRIGSILKRDITSPTIMIERKGETAVKEENIGNYVIISNHEAVQDENGRKYFVLDLNPKYRNNFEYFSNLHKNCSNKETGEAFFSYLNEYDTEGFLPLKFPITRAKQEAKSRRLDSAYEFLKQEYILKEKEIGRQSVSDLHNEYQKFCTTYHFKPKDKIKFNSTLRDIGIEYTKSNGTNVYKISKQTLEDIANKFGWICDLDEYVQKNDESEDVADCDIKELQKENIQHRRLIHKLKALLKANNVEYDSEEEVKPIVTKKSDTTKKNNKGDESDDSDSEEEETPKLEKKEKKEKKIVKEEEDTPKYDKKEKKTKKVVKEESEEESEEELEYDSEDEVFHPKSIGKEDISYALKFMKK